MFSTEENQAQGISAVKALAIAAAEGQRIWTIDQSNVDLALGQLELTDGAETDIRNAVFAGKVATAHENQINFNGWIGEGYILMDPDTGAAAYIISGGGNGGILMAIGLMMLFLWVAVVASALLIGVFAAAGPLAVALAPTFISYLLGASVLVVSSALALIFRGIESIALGSEDASWACNKFQASVSAFLGGLLFLLVKQPFVATLVGAGSGFVISDLAPCLEPE